MSYLVQMAGLTVHNFLSAATGIALAVALIRGFARRQSNTVGNFWVDMTRCTLYVLLPVSIVVGLLLRLAGHAAKPAPLYRGHDPRRRQAVDRARPGGVPGSHQDVRDQWRRLLQRQLVASVREPEPAHEFHSARADLLHRRGAHECVRPDGRRPAAGLGHLRRDGAFCSLAA